MQVEGHVVTVLEGRFAVEQLLSFRPPAALLGSIAVALGSLLGLETDHRDVPAVVSRTPCRAEPAVRAWRQVPHPPIGSRLHRLRVGYLALDHLSEHVEPLSVPRHADSPLFADATTG